MRILRAMKTGEDGSPEIGDSARTLGVRVGGRRPDVVVAASGFVLPENGGMSVSPPPPENLPEHRRPEKYEGTGNDPVWEIDTDYLSRDLVYRPDPKDPDRHGFIEPAKPMHIENYKALLATSQASWQLFRD